MFDLINKILINDLTTSVPEEVVEFSESIVNRLNVLPVGILFYGSVLRELDPEGILDFYVITGKSSVFNGNVISCLASYLLPPNVYYMEHKVRGVTLRAKVAFLSEKQFLKRSAFSSIDTTIWARFCQPVRLVWVQNQQGADRILRSLRQCVITASCWAALLGPEKGEAMTYWHNLFSHTYAVELRVEKKGRSSTLLEGRESRYTALLMGAWQNVNLRYSQQGEFLYLQLATLFRNRAKKKWRRISSVGRPLNVARLIKAAFTFQGGMAYLLWKIKRHTGTEIHLSNFERNHPILTLPLFLWRIRRMKKNISKI